MPRNFYFRCSEKVSTARPLLQKLGFSPHDFPYDCCDLVIEFLHKHFKQGALREGVSQTDVLAAYAKSFVNEHINSTYEFGRVDYYARTLERRGRFNNSATKALFESKTLGQNTAILLIRSSLQDDIIDYFSMMNKNGIASSAYNTLRSLITPPSKADVNNLSLHFIPNEQSARFDLSTRNIARFISDVVISHGLYDIEDNSFTKDLLKMEGRVDSLMPLATTVPLHLALYTSDYETVVCDLHFDAASLESIACDRLMSSYVYLPRLKHQWGLYNELGTHKDFLSKMIPNQISRWSANESYRHTIDRYDYGNDTKRFSVLRSLYKPEPFDPRSRRFINRITMFRRTNPFST